MESWARMLVSEARFVACEIARSPALRRAALVLLPYIGVIVGLDVAAHYGSITEAELPVQFQISQDRSFGEYLEYAFTAAVAAMLLLLWRRTGATAYLANAVLFVWLTADNAFEIHEGFGHRIADLLPVQASWQVAANDIGEAMLFGAVGLLWAAGLWSSLRAAALRSVIHALILAACVAGAAFFGVAVDLAVVWGEHTLLILELLTWLEDGGEFAMISLAFFLAVGIFDGEKQRCREAIRHGAGQSAGQSASQDAGRDAAPKDRGHHGRPVVR